MSSRRRYRLGKREERAAGTRRRIVEATLMLHDEQGITATSVRDVAGRAGVAASTVLQHFPAMSDLIQACGELSNALAPMPGPAVLVGAATARERVARMATAMFAWWDLVGSGFDHLRIDRRRIPEVDVWLADVERRHRELAAATVPDGGLADLLVALTTSDAWGALRAGGATPEQAGARVAQLVDRSLPREPSRKETLH